MHIFLAGIMQGSRLDGDIAPQTYRQQITQALQSHLPEVIISDPCALHPNSVSYEMAAIQDTFLAMTQLAGSADVVIAYLPRASMGTAIEMWTAYHAKKYIIAVTSMNQNWVVKVTANEILPDLDSLLDYIASGRMYQLFQQLNSKSNFNAAL